MDRNFSPCDDFEDAPSDIESIGFSASISGASTYGPFGFCENALTYSASGSMSTSWDRIHDMESDLENGEFRFRRLRCCKGCVTVDENIFGGDLGTVINTISCSHGGGEGCEHDCEDYPEVHTLDFELDNFNLFTRKEDGVCEAFISFRLTARLTPGGAYVLKSFSSGWFPWAELEGTHSFSGDPDWESGSLGEPDSGGFTFSADVTFS
jgi:hypothetical protein